MVFFNKNLDWIDRVNMWASTLILLSLFFAAIYSVIEQEWYSLFVIILALILSFLPTFFELRYKVDIPLEFEVAMVILVYFSLFLGEVHGYYTLYWWWDSFLHAGTSIALGFGGFIILYALYKGNKINARPSTIAFFSFCFALAIGALWEIFEFSMDSAFGFNMQKSGLADTMKDLIIDAGGAFIASFLGYLYLRGTKTNVFNRLISKVVRDNPNVFK